MSHHPVLEAYNLSDSTSSQPERNFVTSPIHAWFWWYLNETLDLELMLEYVHFAYNEDMNFKVPGAEGCFLGWVTLKILTLKS
jgi:hypothetical protein